MAGEPGHARSSGPGGLRLLRRRRRRHPRRRSPRGKAASVDEIGIALRAGTNCGSCLPELRSIVANEAHARCKPRSACREAARRAWSALARLPVFFALDGKRAVVAGGTPAAAWKAELLLGRRRRTSTSMPPSRREELLAARRRCAARRRRRSIAATWRDGDLPAPPSRSAPSRTTHEAARFAGAARAAGVPVNVIDKPAFCDFSFGAIVNRSPLVIGISTDGAAPVFGQAIRAKLEALIPRGFARWAEAARRWRASVQGIRPVVQRPPAVLAAVHRARGAPSRRRAATTPISSRCWTRRGPKATAVEQGSVTLVGAGPGDPELLTLRAVRALQSADVILFDDLVSPEILDFARREAKKMLVGKTGHGPSCKQDEINALMVALAKAGKRVVRLKGGDPMIFGRAGEEIAACRKAGIAVEVVPGITAAQGAASRLGVSLTQRAATRGACNTSPAMAATARCRTISTGAALPIRRHHRGLHAGEDARRACRERRSRTGSIRQRRRSPCRARRGRPGVITAPIRGCPRLEEAARRARCWS